MIQLGGFIDQIAAQQHGVRFGLAHGPDDLPGEILRALRSKVNIADVDQATRVVTR